MLQIKIIHGLWVMLKCYEFGHYNQLILGIIPITMYKIDIGLLSWKCYGFNVYSNGLKKVTIILFYYRYI